MTVRGRRPPSRWSWRSTFGRAPDRLERDGHTGIVASGIASMTDRSAANARRMDIGGGTMGAIVARTESNGLAFELNLERDDLLPGTTAKGTISILQAAELASRRASPPPSSRPSGGSSSRRRWTGRAIRRPASSRRRTSSSGCRSSLSGPRVRRRRAAGPVLRGPGPAARPGHARGRGQPADLGTRGQARCRERVRRGPRRAGPGPPADRAPPRRRRPGRRVRALRGGRFVDRRGSCHRRDQADADLRRRADRGPADDRDERGDGPPGGPA